MLITTTNDGPADATVTSVTYSPPSGATIDTANLPGTCTPDMPTIGSVTCDLGTIVAMTDNAVTIPLLVDSAATPGSVLSGSSATASSGSTDPDGDLVTADLTLGAAQADLVIATTDSGPIVPGTGEVVSIAVQNLGPSDAPGGWFSYTPPLHTEIATALLPGACVADIPTVGSVSCDVGLLARGADTTLDIAVIVSPGAPADATSTGGEIDAWSDVVDPEPTIAPTSQPTSQRHRDRPTSRSRSWRCQRSNREHQARSTCSSRTSDHRCPGRLTW